MVKRRHIFIWTVISGVLACVIGILHQLYSSYNERYAYSLTGELIRTLEVEADIEYNGRPLRLRMRTECWRSGDSLGGPGLTAIPKVVAAKLPDGAVMAFRGMPHACRLTEQEIGRANLALTRPFQHGDDNLRGTISLPNLPAIWFSSGAFPRLVDFYLSTTPQRGRYRPIAFRLRQVEPAKGPSPRRTFHKLLPAWRAFDGSGLSVLRFCGAGVVFVPVNAFGAEAQPMLRGRPGQILRNASAGTPPWTTFGVGPEEDFSDPRDGPPGATDQAFARKQQADRDAKWTAVQDGRSWSAQPLGVDRYYSAWSLPKPSTIRVGDADLPFGAHFVTLNSSFVASIRPSCDNWR